jgi:2,4-dienoyl-CoA reductase-like NADH-dependent reductase (Old Yellow Enzyme family)
MPGLFDPITLGAIHAPSRILMAPLTRARGTRDHLPTELMIDYYVQRAGAGLIISEAIGISRQGLGWPYATGLWSDAQVAGWRRITDAVHAAGGRIVAQLWHMGRVVHPDFLDGAPPVSASATTAPDFAHTYAGKQPYAEARPLAIDEIPGIVADYAAAARNAIAAGFDGVQLHAANGYLIDQFLRDSSNRRDDAYGGSVENRIRLLLEVTEAVGGAIGMDRTAVRLSPDGTVQGVVDSDPHHLFPVAAEALGRLGIAFLELREPGGGIAPRPAQSDVPVTPLVRARYAGPLVLNNGYDGARAAAALSSGAADAISFGRPFIANPDLPQRLAADLPLDTPDPSTFYVPGPRGYTDYPVAA